MCTSAPDKVELVKLYSRRQCICESVTVVGEIPCVCQSVVKVTV